MALTCTDAFSNNTVPATLCVVQQKRDLDGLARFELFDNRDFLALVLDSLVRLRSNPGTFPMIQAAEPCDVQQASVLAQCTMSNRVTPTERLGEDKLKAYILWMLNEALCT